MGGAGALRKVLLRPRRDGESHQGADVPLRRPALHRRDARQSVAPLLLRPGLHPGGSPTPAGPQGHRVGSGPGRYHPPQAVQDRRHRARKRTPHHAPDEFGLPLERPLCTRLPRSALLKNALHSELPTFTGTFARRSYANNLGLTNNTLTSRPLTSPLPTRIPPKTTRTPQS